ncbi:type II toxin-antitoxin system Phd/YefM family antitoxin [Thiosulfativibrio zosterae]|uniref:Antitoxin n=1 Tax=Thiosulfativibrio zosterae TaxID=2675053 RepID=A0A6F8PQ67_9GAMM|nr:type II toxin-antitoxin system Phd/YefM family antitoxin [Thiosulfativibrio zosterae]BBP44272.1 hypothetical protein THMIRHAT_20180 [Thiosulfativibrio zosterae]
MQSIQVGQLKAEFSSILERLQATGEGVVIEYGKQHKKVAMLIPYDSSLLDKPDRPLGLLQGKANYALSDDFEITEEAFLGL